MGCGNEVYGCVSVCVFRVYQPTNIIIHYQAITLNSKIRVKSFKQMRKFGMLRWEVLQVNYLYLKNQSRSRLRAMVLSHSNLLSCSFPEQARQNASSFRALTHQNYAIFHLNRFTRHFGIRIIFCTSFLIFKGGKRERERERDVMVYIFLVWLCFIYLSWCYE